MVLIPTAVQAHEVRPGYLELRESSADTWEVMWKVPSKGDLRLRLDPSFPPQCRATSPVATYPVPGAFIERWTVKCEESLIGKSIAIAGLEATLTDVLVRLEPLDAPAQTARLRPEDPIYVVAAAPSRMAIARTYLVLGVEHILGGIDHLLFVLALLLIVHGWRQLLATITAFTIAHSITLALATLGFVHMPSAPVEAVIALSILFLATEIVHGREGRPGLTERYPWVVAFTFGLLHGFGFAGALSEVGLPEAEIPLALFLFNVGVEVGQVMFVAGFLILVAVLEWTEARLPAWSRPAWAWRVPTYGVGSVAAFWTIQRVAGFWG